MTRPRQRWRPFLNVALMTAAVSSAGGCWLLDSTVCHTGIFFEVEPRAVTISVGESFTPRATMDSCPAGRQEITLTWFPEDPAVVSVESGVATGVGAGETSLNGRDEGGAVLVMVSVLVVE